MQRMCKTVTSSVGKSETAPPLEQLHFQNDVFFYWRRYLDFMIFNMVYVRRLLKYQNGDLRTKQDEQSAQRSYTFPTILEEFSDK